MDGKIGQHVCMKFCVQLSKSATVTLEMLCEAFGQGFLNDIHVSRLVKCQLKMTNAQGDKAPTKRQKMLKKFENSSTKTKQSMCLQQLWSLPGDLKRKFKHAPHCSFITTTRPPSCP
jgi:hypothetical protein